MQAKKRLPFDNKKQTIQMVQLRKSQYLMPKFCEEQLKTTKLNPKRGHSLAKAPELIVTEKSNANN